MKKIVIVAVMITLVVVASIGGYLLTREEPQEEKVYRVGILSGVNAFVGIIEPYKEKMTELGYVEGENIEYDIQKVNADPEGEKVACEKFVEDKVDLIFTFPTEPSLTAKEAAKGTGIPVVFAHAGLEGSDLVESVTEPGEGITGVRWPGSDLVVKRYEFLMKMMPDLEKLYVPYDKNYPLVPPALDVFRPVAASNGVTLVELPATTVEDLKADLEVRKNATDIGMDAILLLPELIMQSP